MAVDYTMPDWMKPPSGIGWQGIQAAMQFGAQQRQQQVQNQLQLSEFALKQKQVDAETESRLLQNHLVQNQLDDAMELKKWNTAKKLGQKYEPNLSTHVGILSYEALLSKDDEEQARLSSIKALTDTYSKVVKEMPEAAPNIDQFRTKGGQIGSPFTGEWTPDATESLTKWKGVYDEMQMRKSIAEKSAIAQAQTEARLPLEQERTRRYLETADIRGQWSLFVAEQKNKGYQPHPDTFIRDIAKKMVDRDMMLHPDNPITLETAIRAAKDEYNKTIVETGAPPSTDNPPPVLKYNRETGVFK
jgi:hypothetical protein